MFSQDFSVIIDHDISAPGHGREVVYGINSSEKTFLLQLIPTVQLTSEKGYEKKVLMHNGDRTHDVSLARKFQKHLSNSAYKHGVIDQENTKRERKQKWTEREYPVQYYADVKHKYVKMFCNKNQFSSLPFCSIHTQPHDVRGLSKNLHMRFYTKMGNGIYKTCYIPCDCAKCKSML